ncbi:barstar family protein [Chitinibacter sp. SCUT-21]|uniref:barstar family protein n=1 Tax=Chitinibacter sp. SCUT-21 TaxID=2970891 RepID=UPI0035A698E8
MFLGTQITLRDIQSLDDAYNQISTQAHLPNTFGRNLDALFDVLSLDLEGPVQITWQECAQAQKIMPGTQFEDLMCVLKDAAGERSDLQINIT